MESLYIRRCPAALAARPQLRYDREATLLQDSTVKHAQFICNLSTIQEFEFVSLLYFLGAQIFRDTLKFLDTRFFVSGSMASFYKLLDLLDCCLSNLFSVYRKLMRLLSLTVFSLVFVQPPIFLASVTAFLYQLQANV